VSDKIHGPSGEWPLDKHLLYLVGLSEALGSITLNAALVHEICHLYTFYKLKAERLEHQASKRERRKK